MARTQSPAVNQASRGAVACTGLLIDQANSVWMFTVAGAPTAGTSGDGAGWAGPGSLCTDITNKKLYINTNTKLSPTWTVVGAQT